MGYFEDGLNTQLNFRVSRISNGYILTVEDVHSYYKTKAQVVAAIGKLLQKEI